MATDFPINAAPALPDATFVASPAARTGSVAGTRAWRINRRLALATLLALGVLVPSIWLWHHVQVRRNAAVILTRAKALSGQEDWKAATAAFRQYLQLRPDDSEALVALAKTFDKFNGDPEQRLRTVTLYFQALRANPNQSQVRMRLAELLLETGRLEEATQQARQVATERPDDLDIVRIQARILHAQLVLSRKGSVGEVVQFYRQALAQHRGDIVLSTGLADVLRRFHEALPADERDSAASAADAVIDAMVELHPDDPDVLLARYRYRAAHQLPGGLDDLENALQAAPENPTVLLACVVALRDGDPAKARELGERLLEIDPGNRRAYLTVASLYSRINQPEEAVRVLETAAGKLGPDDFNLNRGLLQIFLAQQDSERAMAALAQLEPLFHRHAPYLPTLVRRRFAEEFAFARVQLQCLAGDSAQALPALKRLASSVTESSDAAETLAERQRRWKLLAAVYAREGLHDQAAAAFDQLARLDPRSREGHLLAAREWQRIGDIDRAVRHLEAATTGEPEMPVAWLGLAELRLQQQLRKTPVASRDWSGFDAAFKRAAAGQGESPRVLILSAAAGLARGNRGSAMQSLTKLTQQARLDAVFLPRIAMLFQDAGAAAEAQATLERFRRSGGNADVAALTEAELLRRRGDSDAALKTLEQALERASASARGAILQSLIAAEIDSGAIQSARLRLQRLRQADFPELWAYETAADLAIVAGYANDLRECAQQIEAREGSDGTLWRFVRSIQLLESEKEGNEAVHQANRWAAEIETLRPAWPQLQVLRGRIADRMGRTAEAIEAYEQALGSGARNLAVYHWLVSALQRQNRFAEASSYIGPASQMAALSDELAAQAIPAGLRAGRMDAAMRIARTAAELRPADPAAQVWYAQTLALNGNIEASENLLRITLERAPQEARAWSALIWVLHRAKRPAEARQTLDQMVVRLSLDSHERELVLARGYDLLGDDRAAERSYRQALIGHDKDSQLLQEVGRFYLRIDHDQALTAFQQALAINPKLIESRRTVAWLLGLRGSDAEWGRALAVLNEGDNSAAPDDRRIQAALLLVHGGSANVSKASGLLFELVNRNESPQAGDRLLLGRAYEQLNRFTDARKQFEAAVKSNDTPAFRAQFVQFLVRQKQFDEALALTLGKSDGTDSARDALTVVRLLTIAASCGTSPTAKLAAAETFLIAAQKSQAGNLAFLLELGVLRTMQGRIAEAVGLFEAALKKNPTNPAALNNLALALADSPDRRNEALRIIDKALSLLPASPELLDSKAQILIGTGRYRDAREILDPLCRTHATNPRYRLHLAMAVFPLKELDQSRALVAQAVDDGLEKELLTPTERRAWRQIANQLAGVTTK